MEPIYVKDIIKLFDVDVDIYYKGQFVMSSRELPHESDCWVMKERVETITVDREGSIGIETR